MLKHANFGASQYCIAEQTFATGIAQLGMYKPYSQPPGFSLANDFQWIGRNPQLRGALAALLETNGGKGRYAFLIEHDSLAYTATATGTKNTLAFLKSGKFTHAVASGGKRLAFIVE